MTDHLVITGGNPLKGSVRVSGSKNASGAILAATLLTKDECIIGNLPLVADTLNLLKILENMGAEISWKGERTVKIKASKINPEHIDFNLIRKSRISVMLIGGLLSRFKEFKIAHPGGDRIGLRPITTHLKALKKLGIEVEKESDFYHIKSQNRKGCEIVLEEFSVTATQNVIMAAVTTPGKTVIKGAAAEPQVQDLGALLNKMGAQVEGTGTHDIIINGVEKLKGTSHDISPDLVEAATFVIAGAVSGGEIEVKGCNPSHLDLFLAKLTEIGVKLEKGRDVIKVFPSKDFQPTRIQAFPYPGFQTDILPLILPLLTQAQGKSLIHDPLYENRLNFTQELRKMGANIEVVDPHRAFIFGPTPLSGVKIESWDIRAGASLIIAALMAKGQSTIENIIQIDRGYEKIEEKLQKLGADIKRISN
ncbi:UDP-N-acetylglucosamine 1-carboxyvinyltransferase [Patescibacteria group bacterium]